MDSPICFSLLSLSKLSKLEPRRRDERSAYRSARRNASIDQGIAGARAVGQHGVAVGFGLRYRRQSGLQHCGGALSGADWFWPRQRGLHPADAGFGGHAFVSDRLRQGNRATELAGRKKRGLSPLRAQRLGRGPSGCAGAAAVSHSDLRLPESAHSASGGAAGHWARLFMFRWAAGEATFRGRTAFSAWPSIWAWRD